MRYRSKWFRLKCSRFRPEILTEMFEILTEMFEFLDRIEILTEIFEILTKVFEIWTQILEISTKMLELSTKIFEISTQPSCQRWPFWSHLPPKTLTKKLKSGNGGELIVRKWLNLMHFIFCFIANLCVLKKCHGRS